MTDTPKEQNESALMQSFIEKITPTISEAVIGAVAEKVEAQIKGVLEKNDELLSEVKGHKATADTFAQMLAEASNTTITKTGGEPVVISKVDARDVRKYRAARALAEERGVAFEIDRG